MVYTCTHVVHYVRYLHKGWVKNIRDVFIREMVRICLIYIRKVVGENSDIYYITVIIYMYLIYSKKKNIILVSMSDIR